MAPTPIDAVRQRNRQVMRQALNIKDIAYQLNCSEKCARQRLYRNEIRHFRVGVEYRVLQEDLDAFIQAQMESA
jgi:excisionase family DNA binding protein